MVRRGRLAQGLVRPLVVVPGAVGIEDPLLPAGVGPTGLRASSFRVRWNRSRRPFCSGCPGWMRSGITPSLTNQTAS